MNYPLLKLKYNKKPVTLVAEGELEDLREKAITLGYSPSEIIIKGPTVTDPDGIVVEFSI